MYLFQLLIIVRLLYSKIRRNKQVAVTYQFHNRVFHNTFSDGRISRQTTDIGSIQLPRLCFTSNIGFTAWFFLEIIAIAQFLPFHFSSYTHHGALSNSRHNFRLQSFPRDDI